MRAAHNEPLKDNEYPDDYDINADSDSVDFKFCQNCGGEIFDDADQCVHCGYWQMKRTGSWRDSSKFYVRVGSWAMKTLVLNWLFWIFISAIATVTIWMKWLKK